MSDTRLSSGVSERTFGREPSEGPSSSQRPTSGGPVTYELASWGVRAAAFAIDMLIPLAIGLAIGIGVIAAEGEGEDARRLMDTLVLAVGLPLGLLYAPLLMIRRGAHNGQTLGKQALRIRVVRERGERVTLGNALMREVIGRQLLVAFTYGLYAVIDYLWPLWDKPRQCLHDKVAQTRVVRVEPADRVAGAPADMRWQMDPSPAGPAGAGWSSAPAPEPARAPAPAPPPRPADDRPVRDGWLPPSSGG